MKASTKHLIIDMPVFPLFVGLVLLATVPVAVQAQVYDLSWNTIDGGGTILTSGGAFQLSGTIGQRDSGSAAAPLSGGAFQLVGGFWPAAGTTCALPGDMNVDGVRNGRDIQTFVNCVLGAGANCTCADLDGNGAVNAADADDFVLMLIS